MTSAPTGSRVRRIRQYAGLTGEQFGVRLGVSKQTISLIERGQRDPSCELLSRIVDEFGVDVRYFFGQLETLDEALGNTHDTGRPERDDDGLRLEIRDFRAEMRAAFNRIEVFMRELGEERARNHPDEKSRNSPSDR